MGEDTAMKKLLSFVLLIGFGLVYYSYVSSNPIVSYEVINELAFTSKKWVIEIVLLDTMNTSGWYLVSKTDTAHLKSMTIPKNIPYLIKKDSLLEPFHIDSTGDMLKIYTQEGIKMGEIAFSYSGYSISAPKPGQSICLDQMHRYYLDNTPTLGRANDTLNANGIIAVWVRDNNSLPLENVQVLCSDTVLTTDASGYFSSSVLAKYFTVACYKDNYTTGTATVQVWPESTITANIVMNRRGQSIERIILPTIPTDYFMSNPFPNPFNPEVQIQYSIPSNSNVKIEVFDICGKLVDKIFSGFQSADMYQAYWNAVRFTSGVYIIRIQAGEVVLNKKCALVK
jgi:hypothetical protein